MAYEKHTWETGETITAEKLNNLENGISNNFLVVNDIQTGNTHTLDKTWKEIADALHNKIPVFLLKDDTHTENDTYIYFVLIYSASYSGDDQYMIFYEGYSSDQIYRSTAPNDYPSYVNRD